MELGSYWRQSRLRLLPEWFMKKRLIEYQTLSSKSVWWQQTARKH